MENAESHTILIVDDEKPVRYALRKKLQEAGYNVLEACDGNECLVLAEKHEPSLILLDLIMPEMGGLNVLNHLNDHDTLKHTPVIILSNNSDDVAQMASALKGYTQYLIKYEHSLESILEKVEKLISVQKNEQ